MLQTAVRVIEKYKIRQFIAHLVTAPTLHTKFKNFVARDSCNKRITDTNSTTTHNCHRHYHHTRTTIYRNQLYEQAIPDSEYLVGWWHRVQRAAKPTFRRFFHIACKMKTAKIFQDSAIHQSLERIEDLWKPERQHPNRHHHQQYHYVTQPIPPAHSGYQHQHDYCHHVTAWYGLLRAPFRHRLKDRLIYQK